jgi:eukaryotic-like serine/threonine-protein kinase
LLPADPAPVALVEGRVFHGRYEIVRCLQAGGMGAVYEVVDRNTRRRRALKVMLPGLAADADLRARFKLEATITAEIESPHLVETLDADVDAETGAPFVVMELLKGEDLGATLARRGGLPFEEALGLLHQAALGLEKTHAAGVIHRDLKPGNLFVTTSDDGSMRLRVLDFGIAKLTQSGGPLLTTRALGTPLFMPPEQIRGDGDIGPRADGYALGHVAYALLTGEPYWNEESSASPALYAIFSRVLAGVVEAPTARARRRSSVTLPPAFDGWFAQATALQAADRFASASDLVAALASALGLPRLASPVAPAEMRPPALSTPATTAEATSRLTPHAGSRSALPWLVGAALVVALVVAVAGFSFRSGPASVAGRGELAAMATPSTTATAITPDPSVFPGDRRATSPPGAASSPAAPASAAIVAPHPSHRSSPASAPSAPVPPVRGGSTGDYDPTDVR